jgi:hypothetical protein
MKPETETDSPGSMDINQNFWTVAAISLGGGGFASQVASTFGDLGFGLKLVLAGGIAAIIFGTIYFFGSTSHA